jgi:Tfp pilus assembly protein PilE
MNCKKDQSGFVLLEIIVGVILLSIVTFYATGGFTATLNFNARVETKTRLDAWRTSLEKFYFDNAMAIDSDAGAQLNLGGTPTPTIIPQYLPNATTKVCSMSSTAITEIANRAGYAASDFAKDGGRRSFCLYITPRLTQTLNGATLYYHSIAVVSPGKDGVIDTGTQLTSTGELQLAAGGDDTGILFDGRKFSADKYNATMENMRRVVSAYDAYYAARYQADPNRSLSTDYFSCGQATCPSTLNRWDGAGEMRGTCTAAVPLNPTSGIKPYEVLGLSLNDTLNGWGGDITIDNCTNAVRSPNNSSIPKQTPPYTALVSTTIPGGAVISSTSVGQI